MKSSRIVFVVALLFASIPPLPAAPRKLTPSTWMERSRKLGAAVKIEDLHYERVTTTDGRAGIAVVGRVVNGSGTALSLLAIHLGLEEPTRVSGNVPVIVGSERLAPGASKTFAFLMDPAAAEGFVPVESASLERPRLSAAETRSLGRINAYVTYAGE
jgi:hypothetical protein